MRISGNPPLPELVPYDESSNQYRSRAYPEPRRGTTDTEPLSLQHGCYLLQWRLRDLEEPRLNGVMRVEKRDGSFMASGDLYFHQSFQTAASPAGVTPSPDPNPSAGIPSFPRSNYGYYVRIIQVPESGYSSDTLTLRFARFSHNSQYNLWNYDGDFTSQMTFKAAPESYPSGATYLEGEIKDQSRAVVGNMTLGWVSKYLRKATLEVDRVPMSEYPTDSGVGVSWKDVYGSVDWDMNVYESDTDLVERSGESWSDAEMHAEMLDRRDSVEQDHEWRYYLICVRRLDSTSRGIMFDAFGGDSNRVPREGAGISSHWVIPNEDPPWGTVAGQRFGTAPAPYFRTAVHEIGHAMGLYHNSSDNGFMNTTGVIAASDGTFPNNIQWAFNAADGHRLRHMPDPWVRPGMIPFGKPYRSTPMSPADRLNLSKSASLDVKPLLTTVPIGAPVRVRVTLRNTGDAPLMVPNSLSIKSGHIYGHVAGPGGSNKGFQSVMCCVEEHEYQTIQPQGEISHDMTLLRGRDGALFEAPGSHEIKVDAIWDVDMVHCYVHGSAMVMVQPAKKKSHSEAAVKILSTPDLLLTLALGGDHLKDGVEALQAALADETLAPHYRVIEAKRLARRFRTRGANPSAALKLLASDTVMSPSEAKRMAELLDGVAKRGSSAVEVLKKAATGDKAAEEMVDNLSYTKACCIVS